MDSADLSHVPYIVLILRALDQWKQEVRGVFLHLIHPSTPTHHSPNLLLTATTLKNKSPTSWPTLWIMKISMKPHRKYFVLVNLLGCLFWISSHSLDRSLNQLPSCFILLTACNFLLPPLLFGLWSARWACLWNVKVCQFAFGFSICSNQNSFCISIGRFKPVESRNFRPTHFISAAHICIKFLFLISQSMLCSMLVYSQFFKLRLMLVGEGKLPLVGTLPDLKSSTLNYVSLQNMFVVLRYSHSLASPCSFAC